MLFLGPARNAVEAETGMDANGIRAGTSTSVARRAARFVPRRRWGIAVLLGFGVLVNYFDRVNLSVAKEAFHPTLVFSRLILGYLLSAYSWMYGAFKLPPDLILDRFGV